MRRKTFESMRDRVEKLCSGFPHYIARFDESDLFTGPSLYFHFRTLNQLHKHVTFSRVFEDNLFFEYLYATLTSWGLHRMRPVKAKLVDFEIFFQSFQHQRNAIEELQNISLIELSDKNVPIIVDKLWNILKNIKVSTSKTRLVANSKALHHILPHTMPPIDREYTLRFFYNRKTIQGRDEKIFREIYPWFHRIGLRNKIQIESYTGHGFHTSETKVIDNAIVGFVLPELEKICDRHVCS